MRVWVSRRDTPSPADATKEYGHGEALADDARVGLGARASHSDSTHYENRTFLAKRPWGSASCRSVSADGPATECRTLNPHEPSIPTAVCKPQTTCREEHQALECRVSGTEVRLRPTIGAFTDVVEQQSIDFDVSNVSDVHKAAPSTIADVSDQQSIETALETTRHAVQQLEGQVESPGGGSEAYDPEAEVEPEEPAPPAFLHVDELRRASARGVVPSEREVFLSDLPLEDYTEAESTAAVAAVVPSADRGGGETSAAAVTAAGAPGAKSVGRMRRIIFIDELPMPKRPDVPPARGDREVFLQSLPVRDCTEAQIHAWLAGFGKVEDICLLRDHLTEECVGKGYVRFSAHSEARACVDSQASVQNAEDGDVVAWWSESERAAQRTASVYGLDVHAAFAGASGRVLASVLVSAKLKALRMVSELHGHIAPDVADAKKQLHFSGECDEEQFEKLRAVLARALEAFHEKAATHLASGGGPEPLPSVAASPAPVAAREATNVGTTTGSGVAAASPTAAPRRAEEQEEEEGVGGGRGGDWRAKCKRCLAPAS